MKTIMKQAEIHRALLRIIHEIIEKNEGSKNIVLIGIKRRGDIIAQRMAALIKEHEGRTVPLGALDITLYRDDLQLVSDTPIIESTDIPFDINKKTIILVDDVLYTGRTIRAAMEELFNFGRPKAIQLAILVDRGLRELPIQADFVGKYVPTARDQIVDVHMKETDGEDCILIRDAKPAKKTRKKHRSKKISKKKRASSRRCS
jgi:pyrimidine operon attenuation protein/uracil phosphoribosyltransferase